MSEGAAAAVRLSVVIPAWNDHANLAVLVPAVVKLNPLPETIVVDASPDRQTEALILNSGAIYLRAAQPNRGAQLNLGAARATGDVLIFHHADSLLSGAHLAAIARALRDPAVIGGAFYRKFDARHPRLVWLEKAARFLTRHGGTFFGDQSLFVRRSTFAQLGGFAPLPLMEDVEFSARLHRAGKVVALDPPVVSSARRHHHRGARRTSIENGIFILLYKCGVSPARLHRWYYRDQLAAPNGSACATQPVDAL